MCIGCTEIYGQENLIFKTLRGEYEAFRMPETQKEWNALYPELKKKIDEFLKDLEKVELD